MALAAALGAERCEICSDVDGVFSADPRIVDEAEPLEAVSYEEMLELARHGASVLNTRAVEWAARERVVLMARSTFSPSAGTIVRDLGSSAQPRVVGVACHRRLLRVSMRGEAASNGLGDEVLKRLGEPGIFRDLADRELKRRDLLVAAEDLANLDGATSELSASFGAELDLRSDLGSVSVVGLKLGRTPGQLMKGRASLERAGIAVEGSFGLGALTGLSRCLRCDVRRGALASPVFRRDQHPRGGGIVTLAPVRSATPETLAFRTPDESDGAAVWHFVRDVGVLELNSAYCYMLMFAHHGASCVVAEEDDELVGFVLAYRPPNRPSTIFVWQIGVAESMRGRGLGLTLLNELLSLPANRCVRYLEASVTETNVPSRRLFGALAREFDTECSTTRFFEHDLFPDSHESEDLLRIGPIMRSSLTPERRRST